MEFKSFHPPRRILLGPGPSEIHSRVLGAMARTTISHLDPEFQTLMDQIHSLLGAAFQTENDCLLPLVGPEEAGLEFCFVNLLEPGDTAVVCVNGRSGERMRATAERCRANVVALEFDWGRPVDPEKLRATLKAHPETKVVAFCQAESSTGVLSDAGALAAVAREFECMTIADVTTALGGNPVAVDEREIDAAFGTSRQCLSAPAGLAPVTLSPRAVAAVRARKTPVQSRVFDLNALTAADGHEGHSSIFAGAAANAYYGFSEALLMLHEEGVERAFARHETNHRAFQAGAEAMGLEFAVDQGYRLPQINAIKIPNALKDESAIREMLLKTFNMEIGGGPGALAGKIWRVGFMGQSCSPSNVLYSLAAFETVLLHANVPIQKSMAQDAARAVYEAAE